VQQGHAGVLQHGSLFRQIAAAAEVLPLTADDDHLDVVIDVALVNEVGVHLAHAERGRVLCLRTVEGDGGDAVLLVLLEPDVLLGLSLQLFVVELRHAHLLGVVSFCGLRAWALTVMRASFAVSRGGRAISILRLNLRIQSVLEMSSSER
jgi:hypothetical protein